MAHWKCSGVAPSVCEGSLPARANCIANKLKTAQNWHEHILRVAEVEQSYLTAISKSRQTRDESKIVANKLYQPATEPQFAVYLQSTGTIEAARNTLPDQFTDEKSQQMQHAQQLGDEAWISDLKNFSRPPQRRRKSIIMVKSFIL